jgi:hypothetical protein
MEMIHRMSKQCPRPKPSPKKLLERLLIDREVLGQGWISLAAIAHRDLTVFLDHSGSFRRQVGNSPVPQTS